MSRRPVPVPSLRSRAAVLLAVAALATLVHLVAPPAPASAVGDAPTPQSFLPRAPMRMADTRQQNAPLGPGESRVFSVPVASVGTGPAGTDGYAMNITAVGATQATHLTVYPFQNGAVAPNASFVNLRPGETRATFTMVKTVPSVYGDHFAIRNNSGTVHVVIDVFGYVGPTNQPQELVAVPPTRLVDTRLGQGATRLGPGQAVTVTATDVPGATAVLVNTTAVQPSTETHLTTWRAGDALPDTSSVNARAGEVTPNTVLTRVDAQGRFSIRNNSGQTDVVVDLIGVMRQGTGPKVGLITPVRILDTRTGGPVGPGGVRNVLPTAGAGVPDDLQGALLSVTLVGPAAPTHLTTWTYGGAMPVASTVNAGAGQTAANLTLVRVHDLTKLVSVANNAGSTHIVVDIVGWTR
ncbi:MAG: hypothetical protein MUF83_08870 [Acidimicrobiales bacterium]|jgi:hypothetical protein|nr:hypothetical protein [Acidimicrobiales bacterium]